MHRFNRVALLSLSYDSMDLKGNSGDRCGAGLDQTVGEKRGQRSGLKGIYSGLLAHTHNIYIVKRFGCAFL